MNSLNTQNLSIEVSENRNFTLWKMHGTADLTSWLTIIQTAPPAGSSRLLIDFSACSSSNIIVSEISEIVEAALLRKNTITPERTALVVGEDLSFGLGRMYSSLSEVRGSQVRFNIFTDPDEALAWLTR